MDKAFIKKFGLFLLVTIGVALGAFLLLKGMEFLLGLWQLALRQWIYFLFELLEVACATAFLVGLIVLLCNIYKIDLKKQWAEVIVRLVCTVLIICLIIALLSTWFLSFFIYFFSEDTEEVKQINQTAYVEKNKSLWTSIRIEYYEYVNIFVRGNKVLWQAYD
ncbi:MAG: hypothetical protein LBM65_07675 [Oscillospiraceae bacterium]|nr:hypothetical protein [Oscillospiraceae bacterium]